MTGSLPPDTTEQEPQIRQEEPKHSGAQSSRTRADRRAEAGLTAALSFVAGLTDVTSWLTLGGLFTAHITGNLVVMAADLVNGRDLHAAQVFAVPLFIFVAAAVALIARARRLSDRALVTRLLWAEAVLLAAASVVAVCGTPSHQPHGLAAGLVAALAVAAMASQNAIAHLATKPSPTTSAMTGNVVVASMSLAAAAGSGWKDAAARSRWQAAWPVLAGFVLGCSVGAATVSVLDDLAWIAAAAAAILCAAGATRLMPTSRSKR